MDAAYRAKYEHDLIHAIEKEFSGSDCAALSFFGTYCSSVTTCRWSRHSHLFCVPAVRLNLNAWPFLAEHIEGTMAGVGTDETALSAAIVRYHPYLSNIKAAYEKKYETSLRDRIEAEVGGEYQGLLLQLLDPSRSLGSLA